MHACKQYNRDDSRRCHFMVHLCWPTHYKYVIGQLYVWTKLANGVCSKVINFVLSPLMVAQVDSFSKFVLTQVTFVV